jgi:hypothetical protein
MKLGGVARHDPFYCPLSSGRHRKLTTCHGWRGTKYHFKRKELPMTKAKRLSPASTWAISTHLKASRQLKFSARRECDRRRQPGLVLHRVGNRRPVQDAVRISGHLEQRDAELPN